MGKKQEYTCESYIRGADGELIPFSTLPPEEKEAVRRFLIARAEKALGESLSAHPAETREMIDKGILKVISEDGGAA